MLWYEVTIRFEGKRPRKAAEFYVKRNGNCNRSLFGEPGFYLFNFEPIQYLMTRAEHTAELIFRTIGDSHNRAVMLLKPFFEAKTGDKIEITIDFTGCQMVYSDTLVLVVNAIVHARQIGIEVVVKLVSCSPENQAVQYASRVDFFKLIGAQVHEVNGRVDSSGRFMEIQEFNVGNIRKIYEEIMKVLFKEGVSEAMLIVFEFCLWEILDNTIIHSVNNEGGNKGVGLVACQYFPTGSIRLMISDVGRGIHEALTTHPKSQFKTLSEKEALEKCIQLGVTNSEGKGFGLWATSELAKVNGGCLKIFSGGHVMNCTDAVSVYPGGYWKGASTFIEVNTKRPVDYKVIFGNDDSRVRQLAELKEGLFVNSNNLW